MKIKLNEIIIGKNGDSSLTTNKISLQKEGTNVYPVYSSATINNGIVGYTSDWMYDGEYITWTKDGYAGNIFLRSDKFNISNSGILIILKNEFTMQYSHGQLTKYIYYNLLAYHVTKLKANATGTQGTNKHVYWSDFSNLEIELPKPSEIGSIISNISKFEELIQTKKENDILLLEKVKDLKNLMLLKMLN